MILIPFMVKWDPQKFSNPWIAVPSWIAIQTIFVANQELWRCEVKARALIGSSRVMRCCDACFGGSRYKCLCVLPPIIRVVLGSLGTPCYTLGPFWIAWDPLEPLWNFYDHWDPFGPLLWSLGPLGTPWEGLGIPWNSFGSLGIPWDP